MNPSLSLKQRWENVRVLAKNTPKEFTIFSLIKQAKTIKDKQFIVSTLSQYLRKSNDANTDKQTVKDMVKMDKSRS
jgi:hypothetical protein